MLFLYNLGIRIYSLLLWFASWVNPKATLWLKGQKELIAGSFRKLKSDKKRVWFHFPSLGEFEQGRPVLERIKMKYPEKEIIITFFSPSGYEAHKNYPLAEYIFYLPIDTSHNAKEFIRLINPELAVFTKYDYWYHYFNELSKQKIPLFIISAFFWKEHSFFQWYGAFQRKMLTFITEIFVQDESSKTLLNEIGIKNVTVSGDTRFDRVVGNAVNAREIPEIQTFCKGSNVFIAGSTWPEDEKLVSKLTEDYPEWRFIIAPHEISESRINSLMKLFPKALKYSEMSNEQSVPGNPPSAFHLPTSDSQILIIDNIGMLSSLYQYGHIAYIGGGFGTGIHNTLEAAVFNLPVVFGPNYEKFREARALIDEGGAFSIKNNEELEHIMLRLQDPVFRSAAGELAGKYVRNHTGATQIIIDHIYPEIP